MHNENKNMIAAGVGNMPAVTQLIMSRYDTEPLPWMVDCLTLCEPTAPECRYWVACEGECYALASNGMTCTATVEAAFRDVLGKNVYAVTKLQKLTAWAAWCKKWSKRTMDGSEGQWMGRRRSEAPPKSMAQMLFDAKEFNLQHGTPDAATAPEPVNQNQESENMKTNKKKDQRKDASAVTMLAENKTDKAVVTIRAYSTKGALSAVKKAHPEGDWHLTGPAPEGAVVTLDACKPHTPPVKRKGRDLEAMNGQPLEHRKAIEAASTPEVKAEANPAPEPPQDHKSLLDLEVTEAINHAVTGVKPPEQKRKHVKCKDFCEALVKAGAKQLSAKQMAGETTRRYPRWTAGVVEWFRERAEKLKLELAA